MTKVIAIVNQKGGTGKTTTTVNLGCALAKKGKKVLLVDLDAQGNMSYSLGILEIEKSIGQVILGEVDFQDILISREGLDVAPAEIDLADVEINIAGELARESILKKVLANVKGYDYILIDCPPSLSLLTINALNAASRVIVPLQMEVLSLQGLDQIIRTIDQIKEVLNEELQIMGLLPVMVDSRRKLSREIFEHIEENYSFKIFNSRIRTNVRASEAPSFGESLISYAPTSNGAKDYMAFADEILKAK
ncbi:chromosome partitioning protein [Reichenbachiella faecimaris]|uniref:Chromosome partitioning protein n=1 Tax=Reichenbachiella faecimaris TaxID=692418 RepID=A0A1W2G903_REIFA|nr:AAA family ATPase [Reichenbachiella faecimaris]SMD32922.1 chromosome partitioning protein [Reichenbachiella faecimaris]